MEKRIENMINDVPVDYNISDALIPFKPLRHLPRIRRIKIPIVKYMEAGINLGFVAGQLVMYASLYEAFR